MISRGCALAWWRLGGDGRSDAGRRRVGRVCFASCNAILPVTLSLRATNTTRDREPCLHSMLSSTERPASQRGTAQDRTGREHSAASLRYPLLRSCPGEQQKAGSTEQSNDLAQQQARAAPRRTSQFPKADPPQSHTPVPHRPPSLPSAPPSHRRPHQTQHVAHPAHPAQQAAHPPRTAKSSPPLIKPQKRTGLHPTSAAPPLSL